MDNNDLIRELGKIFETLTRIASYMEKQSEGNAELHMSDKVMYPPLTSAAVLATENLRDLIERLKND